MNYNQHTLSKSRDHEWNNFIHLSSREVTISQHKPTLTNSNNFIHKANTIHKTGKWDTKFLDSHRPDRTHTHTHTHSLPRPLVRHERSWRTSGPVTTWMGDRLRAGIPSRYVTSQLGQLSLASLRGRLIEYQLRLAVRAGILPLSGGR